MKLYYKPITRIWIRALSCLIILNLSGCSSMLSSKMPSGGITMKQAYNQALTDGDETDDTDDAMDTHSLQTHDKSFLSALRHEVQSPVRANSDANSLSAMNNIDEIQSQFPQVPNPGIVMYVYPHLAGLGANQVPVPGYSTVFSLYQRNYYLQSS